MSARERSRRVAIAVGVVLIVAAIAAATVALAQNPYRLKPGAGGKVCLDCHPDFQQKLAAKVVHAPVKSGECTGCHSPHTSAHGKLLAASTSALCTTCHDGIVPDKAVSRHKVVVEGHCVTCHDPHASPNKALLVKAGNDLCVTCHKTVGEATAKVKFAHAPVKTGCLNCHDPHGSAAAPNLLRKAVPTLCVGCHRPETAGFTRQHANYPVAKAKCTSCHSAHGSDTAGILFDTVHAPVAARRCPQCHQAATAAEPFKTRRPGFELCRGCHGAMVNEVFGKARLHWPLADKTGCLHCHEAHASRQKKLLNSDEAALCGRCHAETVDWQAKLRDREAREKSASRSRVEKGALSHQPVRDGRCTACHQPHGSDAADLMRHESPIEGCGACHDWLKHSSHPMGAKHQDQRNRNLSVDCLSCHRSHGTGNRYLMALPTSSELCVQCHKQLRR